MALWAEAWVVRAEDLARRRAIQYGCAIAGLVALAVVVATYRLGAKSFWLDEGASIQNTSHGSSHLLKILAGGDPNGGLYYALLHVWVRIFGLGEVTVRSLSVLCGVAAVIGMVMLGNRLLGSPAGLISGLLLALAPFFIEYEQTARSYALVVALVIWSSYFFVVELEQPSTLSRVGYVVTSALALYAHYFAAWILLVQLLTLLAVKRRAGLNRRWLVTGSLVALLCVPEVIAALRKGNGGIQWIRHSGLGDLARMPVTLTGGQLISLCLLLLGLYGLLNPPRALRGWRIGFPAAWFVLPILFAFAFSALIRPLFISYYLIVAVPGIILLATAGLIGLRFAFVQGLALTAVLLAAAAGIAQWYRTPSLEDYRGAANYILSHERVGDGVIYSPDYTGTGFEYYAQLRGVRGPTILPFRPGDSSALNQPRRIWFAIRNNSVSPTQQRQIETALRANHAQVGPPASFTNLTVFLYRTPK